MDFDKMLSHRIEMIDVPDELSPENMAKMLKQLPPKMQQEHRHAVKHSNNGKNIIMRSVTAAAAMAAMAAGFIAYTDRSAEPAQLDNEIVYRDVEQPADYDDLFNIYTQIYLSGSADDEYTESVGAGENTAYVTESEKDITADHFADGFADADMVRAENGTVFYVSGGTIYSMTAEGIGECADVSGTEPFELFTLNNRLIYIARTESNESSENTPAENVIDPGSDTSVFIYGLNGGKAVLENSFTQSGRCISARLTSDGKLCLATTYSGRHTEPLSQENDLDSYVPYYLIGNDRHYVAAGDVIVPAYAASTNYTVVSSADISDIENITVKAVLGSSKRVYCSDTTFYAVGIGRGAQAFTTITSFDITNGIEYKASGLVEGIIKATNRLNEYDGQLRAATSNLTDGQNSVDLFVLDDSLSVVNSAGKLLPGEEFTDVSFINRYAVLDGGYNGTPDLVVDLAADPPTVAEEMIESGCTAFSDFTDDLVLGMMTDTDEYGKDEVVLTMFAAANGSMLDSVYLTDEYGIMCDALENRSMLLIDSERQLIGVPVTSVDEFGINSRYYLLSYDKHSGFSIKGQISYTDIDYSGSFRNAVISGDILYVFSDARITAVSLDDMKIIETFAT